MQGLFRYQVQYQWSSYSRDKGEIAEVFGGYFATIAEGIGQVDANKNSLDDFNDYSSVTAITDSNPTDNQFLKFLKIETRDVEEALKGLNPRKATGWDQLPRKALKLGATEIALPLTNLYNICIEQGLWPNDWKEREWTPVHKKDDKLERENYRLVTVQIAINKIFENVVTKQITESFDSRLSEYLTAYRKRHSCETALLFLTESWRQALDTIILLSTDMSKAFDSMLPPLLLAKLKPCNFDEQSLKLMTSYFMHRYSRVKLESTTCTWKRVKRLPSRFSIWAYAVEFISE